MEPDHTEQKQESPRIGGKFVKGQSGNPNGRPKGTVSLTTELKRQLSDGAVISDVVKATIENAKEGNAAALKIVWDRIDGPTPTVLEVKDKSDDELLEDAARIIALRTSDPIGDPA